MKWKPFAILILALSLIAPYASAWSGGGHMTVAYIAYKNLNPGTRAEVDRLIQMNPMYAMWTKGVSDDQKGLVAFVYAATWPDCIKRIACTSGYISDGGDNPPGHATDTQNIGYKDMLMHKYWHFYGTPYSAGAPGIAAKQPNTLTEIQLLAKAIGTNEADDVKSYDIVWLTHLVGDLHQPLHSVARFTANHPKGDAGGNDVAFCALPCMDELHGYWDQLLGESPSIKQWTTTGDLLLAAPKPPASTIADPSQWAAESFVLAKSAVYVAPISDDNQSGVKLSPRPDANYAANAKKVAQSRVLLAGYRLANLLNSNLK